MCSISAVGHCGDNAAAEEFFGMLKRERVNLQRYLTQGQARCVRLHRTLPQPEDATSTGQAGSEVHSVNSAVRENGVEPHCQLQHPDKPGTVTVSGKPSVDIPVGTLNSMLKQAGLKRK